MFTSRLSTSKNAPRALPSINAREYSAEELDAVNYALNAAMSFIARWTICPSQYGPISDTVSMLVPMRTCKRRSPASLSAHHKVADIDGFAGLNQTDKNQLKGTFDVIDSESPSTVTLVLS